MRAVESLEAAADVVAQQWRRCTRQRVERRAAAAAMLAAAAHLHEVQPPARLRRLETKIES